MMKQIVLILFVISFFACSRDTLIENGESGGKVDNELFEEETLLIDKESVNLTAEDAKKVALRFSSIRNDFKTRSVNDWAAENLDVLEIMDTTLNAPLLYVINRGNDEGYVVVSANKKAVPIVVFSDTGCFKPEADIASKSYLEDYKMQIKEAFQDRSDSLRMRYSLEWAIFEKVDSGVAVDARVFSTTVNQMIQDEINRKTTMGYTYIGKIGAAAYYLPADNYQGLVMDISTHTDPAYNYEDVSLFFIKSYDFEQIGPLINTKWHQGEPFNVDAPNGYAGCIPIAVAQIAYYYKHPGKYDWNQIYPFPVLNDGFKYFIKDIRKLCDVTYNSGGTASNYDKAYKAFKSLGYNVAKAGLPDFIKLRNEMKTKNPVYIQGENSQTGKGHAWVCEGYKNIRYEGVISMIIAPRFGEPSAEGSLYFDYVFSAYPMSSLDQNLYGEFYYMNMGWGSTNDGWYRANSYNPSQPENSYLKDQKMITIKR